MADEYILKRDQVQCLINELIHAIKPEGVEQVKIQITDKLIRITPHHMSIEITR